MLQSTDPEKISNKNGSRGNTWIFFLRVKIVDFVDILGFEVDGVRRYLLRVGEKDKGESTWRNTCILESFGREYRAKMPSSIKKARLVSSGTETLSKT